MEPHGGRRTMGRAVALLTVLLMGPSALGQSTKALEDYPSLADVEPHSILLDEFGEAWIVKGEPPHVKGAAAWGRYADLMNKTGWAVLDIHTSDELNGEKQSYAAGFLEGALSHERMAQHMRNMWSVDFEGEADTHMSPKVRQFITDNIAWMRDNVRVRGHRFMDPYWGMVGNLLAQLSGITDGYNAARNRYGHTGEPPLSEEQTLMLSMVDTDMDDLVTAVAAHGNFVNGQGPRLRKRRWRHDKRRHHGHCSALVQVAPDNKDLWVGHVTWDEYRGMTRQLKYLDMPLPGAKSRRLAFTSQPGSLYSGDDWYNTDTGLTILETSIQNYNRSAWKLVKPETVFTWARSLVASRLATNGDEWTELELRYQSGTCNNQWMVVDYKLFTPGKEPVPGTLWVSEAMPGYGRREDVTSHLIAKGGWWPSYNIPYFEDIWKIGGYEVMEKEAATPEDADGFTFKDDPRGRMFERARRHHNVTTFEGFMDFLRYNNHQSDPLSLGDACNAISARCDLNQQNQIQYDCFGAIDAKVRQWRPDHGDLSFNAVSSPAWKRGPLEPFRWSTQNASVEGCKHDQHFGHPDSFDFEWYKIPAAFSKSLSPAVVTPSAPAGQMVRTLVEADVEHQPRAALTAAVCGLLVASTIGGLWLARGSSSREIVASDYVAISA